MFCSKCGKELKEDVSFCTYCGNRLNTDTPKKHRWWIFGAIIVVIDLLIMAVVLNFVSKPKDAGDTETPEENSYIEKAIELVKDGWEKEYDRKDELDRENDYDTDAEHYVEILHTRIVYLKDNDIEPFENVDFVVEFILYTDPYGSSPYYVNTWEQCSVNFYKDGSAELVDGNKITDYLLTTADMELSKILKDVVDFGTKYNRVLELD